MTLYAFLAIGIGAALGAWLRWGFGLLLNPALPESPLGTLAANLFGGYLIGIAMAFFIQHPGVSPEWRLLIITGFLGGLTTFSTFSAETMSRLCRRWYNLACRPAAHRYAKEQAWTSRQSRRPSSSSTSGL